MLLSVIIAGGETALINALERVPEDEY